MLAGLGVRWELFALCAISKYEKEDMVLYSNDRLGWTGQWTGFHVIGKGPQS